MQGRRSSDGQARWEVAFITGAARRSLSALGIPSVEAANIRNAIVFLASDEARYVIGVTLPVDAAVQIK